MNSVELSLSEFSESNLCGCARRIPSILATSVHTFLSREWLFWVAPLFNLASQCLGRRLNISLIYKLPKTATSFAALQGFIKISPRLTFQREHPGCWLLGSPWIHSVRLMTGGQIMLKQKCSPVYFVQETHLEWTINKKGKPGLLWHLSMSPQFLEFIFKWFISTLGCWSSDGIIC